MSLATNQCETNYRCSNCLRSLILLENVRLVGKNDGPDKNSYLTRCQHILCYNCRQHATDRCPACNKNTQFMMISENMREDFKLLFTPIRTLQSYVQDAADFQATQHELITARMAAVQEQMERKCIEAMKLEGNAKEKYEKSVNEVSKLKLINQEIENQQKMTSEKTQSLELPSLTPNLFQRGRDGPQQWRSTEESDFFGAEQREPTRDRRNINDETGFQPPIANEQRRISHERREHHNRAPEFDSSTNLNYCQSDNNSNHDEKSPKTPQTGFSLFSPFK